MNPIPLTNDHREKLLEMATFFCQKDAKLTFTTTHLLISYELLSEVRNERIHWLEYLIRRCLYSISILGRYDDDWLHKKTSEVILSLRAHEVLHPVVLIYDEYCKINPSANKAHRKKLNLAHKFKAKM